MVQFNYRCLYQLVDDLVMLLEVFQGLHGGHFDFYRLVKNFAVYFVDGLHQEKFKIPKISRRKYIVHTKQNVFTSADFGIGGLQSLQLSTKLTGWVNFVSCTCFHYTISCVFKNIWIFSAVGGRTPVSSRCTLVLSQKRFTSRGSF